jgi:hypothetical protein
MAYSTAAVQSPTRAPTSAATALTFAAWPGTGAGNGIKIPNDGDVLLLVRNASGGTATLTGVTPGSVGGLAVADWTVTLANSANTDYPIYLRAATFNQTSGGDEGYTYVDSDAATSVTYAVVRIPRRGT